MKEENNRLTSAEKKLIPLYLEKWQNIALSTELIAKQEVREAVNSFYQFNNLNEPNILFFESIWGAINHLLEDNTIQLRTAIPNLLTLSELKSQILYENYDPDNDINNLELELKQLLSLPIRNIINRTIERPESGELSDQFLELEIQSNRIEEESEKQYWLEKVSELLGQNLTTKELFIQLITNPQTITKIHPEVLEIWQETIERHNITRPAPSPDNNKLKLREIQSLIQYRIPEYRSNVFCQKLVGDCAVIDLKISGLNYPCELEKWKILETLVKNLSWIFPFHAYYYHGVHLPEEYGKVNPSKWKAEWILSEKNAHLRVLLIREIGYLRIFQELSAELLDRWKEYELIKIEEDINPNDFDIEPILLLKMVCPSTNKTYVLRVPPNMTSARVAIRWVNWGIDPEEFSIQT